MNQLDLEKYCLKKNAVTKEYPFDKTTAVYKVANKMFVLTSDDESKSMRINVKCEPLYALELRAIYESVIAGYHMNKKHWNTITCNKEIEDSEMYEFIDDSYALVLSSFSQKKQKEIRHEL